ncbi:DnaJ-domain-containing protein [Microthyrium microscopicum]|uniref:DnaJ-domain-containing protein n=1 Tax=Microthyrium microscopicum TaxID=703497 RepID=A0A6A6UEC3_9PEZI|nr:DnaJ-domain-containing protein [Microthyrium microscopicum]
MDDDLYEVLGVSSTATKVEIKKAYHKAALSSHPDKVPESDRETAEIRFKSVSRAYEILNDEDTRHLYDTHGMSAFNGPGGPGAAGGFDPNDINAMFESMFSGGGGEQDYEVTLEELYKGKTTKFASTKKVICGHCKGSGGKEKAKTTACATCRGKGVVRATVSLGGGLITQQTHECNSCHGTGQVFKDKDKCKKCKGERTISQKKYLELYIPPGARNGEQVILSGEADQKPEDMEPGDLVFTLQEQEHEVFTRKGNDLGAEMEVTLAEALTGLNRIVLTSLDGRGISVNTKSSGSKILRPGDVLKVKGEGMPIKKTDHRGDLFLKVTVKFPDDDWLQEQKAVESIKKALPGPGPPLKAEIVDEVEFEKADLEEFGGEEAEQEWEDDEDEHMNQPQCATQ